MSIAHVWASTWPKAGLRYSLPTPRLLPSHVRMRTYVVACVHTCMYACVYVHVCVACTVGLTSLISPTALQHAASATAQPQLLSQPCFLPLSQHPSRPSCCICHSLALRPVSQHLSQPQPLSLALSLFGATARSLYSSAAFPHSMEPRPTSVNFCCGMSIIRTDSRMCSKQLHLCLYHALRNPSPLSSSSRFLFVTLLFISTLSRSF